jgi:hypothetical protein
MSERIRIIWPEVRTVPASEILAWASDAIANGQLESDYQDAADAGDVVECALALHHAGLITLPEDFQG